MLCARDGGLGVLVGFANRARESGKFQIIRKIIMTAHMVPILFLLNNTFSQGQDNFKKSIVLIIVKVSWCLVYIVKHYFEVLFQFAFRLPLNAVSPEYLIPSEPSWPHRVMEESRYVSCSADLTHIGCQNKLMSFVLLLPWTSPFHCCCCFIGEGRRVRLRGDTLWMSSGKLGACSTFKWDISENYGWAFQYVFLSWSQNVGFFP